ncbi:hypothetical protein FOMPIDRAFT_15267, partial [Fomitopsis schrenkii]
IYGMGCLQLYTYYTRHSQKDGRIVKLYGVRLHRTIDTVHFVLLAAVYFHYTV